tara:strand:+ start:69 stop:566 length:498 start_codon:yes stop_codon:yes gene_type:complete
MKKILLLLMASSLFIGCAIKGGTIKGCSAKGCGTKGCCVNKAVNNTEPSEPKEPIEPTEGAEGVMPEVPDVKMPEMPSITKPTVYHMGISEKEFNGMNDGLEVFDQNKDGIVYMRKECSECNPKYYTFMYGKLEAVTPFHGGLDKMQFDITPPSEVTPSDSTETN